MGSTEPPPLAVMLSAVTDGVKIATLPMASRLQLAQTVHHLLSAISDGSFKQANADQASGLAAEHCRLQAEFTYRLSIHEPSDGRNLTGLDYVAFMLSVHLVQLLEPLRRSNGVTAEYLSLVEPAHHTANRLMQLRYSIRAPVGLDAGQEGADSNPWFVVICIAAGYFEPAPA